MTMDRLIAQFTIAGIEGEAHRRIAMVMPVVSVPPTLAPTTATPAVSPSAALAEAG
jgi:hypothetical protein